MILDIRRFLSEWVVPPGYLQLIRQIALKRSIRLASEEAALLARNTKFKNMHAGRRCFVIGNGPSLNKQDLSPLANEITIVMNWFNKHPIIEKWKPTFFCSAEPRMDWAEKYLPLILEKIDAQAYFFRIEYKELFDKYKWVEPEKVYYLKTGSIPWHEWSRSTQAIDLTHTVPGCRSTTHMALMLALYLGCSPIYLLGLDHDWLAHRSVHKHFYPHLYPGLEREIVDMEDLSNYSYKTMVEGTLDTWSIYESLRNIAIKQGVTIYNATAGGFLDVFPRVEFESLFAPVDR